MLEERGERPRIVIGTSAGAVDGAGAVNATSSPPTHICPRVVRGRKRRVPYIVIAPAHRDAIGEAALRVLREHYSCPLQTIRSPDITLLARLLAGGADRQHAELVSFLLFSPQFAKALIELGKEDAQRWVNQSHDLDGLWQFAPIQS